MDNFDLTKYLAEGRLYENALAQKLRDEAKHPDSKVGAAIFNKYAEKVEKANKEDYVKLLKGMESELIAKHPDTFSGEDDIPGSFLSNEGKLLKEDNLKDYWPEWAAGEIEVGNDDVIDAGGVDADFEKVSDESMDVFKDYVKAVKALNADSKELRDDIAAAVSTILYDSGDFEDFSFDVLTADQYTKIQDII